VQFLCNTYEFMSIIDNDVWIPQTSEITKRKKKNMIVSSKQNHKKCKTFTI